MSSYNKDSTNAMDALGQLIDRQQDDGSSPSIPIKHVTASTRTNSATLGTGSLSPEGDVVKSYEHSKSYKSRLSGWSTSPGDNDSSPVVSPNSHSKMVDLSGPVVRGKVNSQRKVVKGFDVKDPADSSSTTPPALAVNAAAPVAHSPLVKVDPPSPLKKNNASPTTTTTTNDNDTKNSNSSSNNNNKNNNNNKAQQKKKQQQQQHQQHQQQQQQHDSRKPPPSGKKLTRAERRALQESQRAAKEEAKKPPVSTPGTMMMDDPKRRANARKNQIVSMKPSQKQVPMLSHLPQYDRPTSLTCNVGCSGKDIHPAVLRLGLQYANGTIVGSNARCVSLLLAFREVIRDYRTPEKSVLARNLDSKLRPQIQFLIDCRPLSVSMGNSINWLKQRFPETAEMTETKAKDYLCDHIDEFIHVKIVEATKVIAESGCDRISDGDVIMVHACSTSVEKILKLAHKKGKQFRVVVVDQRPMLEGKRLLRRLVAQGIECTYCLTNAVSYFIPKVSKVFLGAYAMYCNGTLISRAGTAIVAMMAHAHNVPVIVYVADPPLRACVSRSSTLPTWSI
eukprot:TRINITY_DN707_c0_g2_i3.p1 TRINITY_DN707_c0_g2~~TRINITY_DN707_c0_g2_i3.p1  ORF type:complete len:563 (-),score=181.80 TRINITY_DN707_c0_g2_i3:105-1793(-)